MPKPPPKDPLDIDDGDGDQNQEPVTDIDPENAEAPKFKPEMYEWSNYDGNPRNYIQIIKRLKKFPLSENTINFDYLNKNLMQNLEEHLNEWHSNSDDYNGIIRITKVKN